MIKKTIAIELETGLEARPVAIISAGCKASMTAIFMWSVEPRESMRKYYGMMTLGLVPGEQVIVTADGADEEEGHRGMKIFDRVEINHFFCV